MLKKLITFIPNLVGRFFKLSWKKKLIVLSLFLIAGILFGSRFVSGKGSGYVFGTVQKRSLTETVTESGPITANGRVFIYSPTNGVVGEIYVSNGEKVTEGQKLFSVKSTATPQEKAAALASYQTAKAAVQQAENSRRATGATVARVHDDLKDKDDTENFIERETRTAAEVANDNAYDALLAARANLSSAEVVYRASQNATVTAPIAGTISNLAVVRGANVSANNVLSPGTTVLIIGGLGTTEITLSVGESDINKIQVGQEAEIKLDAVANRLYRGVVKRSDEHGSVVQGVVKYNLYIEITNPDDQLKPGMTADVDIVTTKITDVLSVPNTAVKPYQKGRAVRVLGSNGKLEFIPVKIGIRGKEFTQIIEGVAEGREIVISLTNEKAGKSGMLGL